MSGYLVTFTWVDSAGADHEYTPPEYMPQLPSPGQVLTLRRVAGVNPLANVVRGTVDAVAVEFVEIEWPEGAQGVWKAHVTLVSVVEGGC